MAPELSWPDDEGGRPFYLDLRPDPVFAVLHAASEPGDAAVLLCPPFGWEDMASHRARRDWAERLAAAGVATLRFDLPGTGDSGGGPHDPARLEAWLDAIDAAAAWLREQTGAERIVALGIGLGGTLATAAALRGGATIDELVLWGARASGRTLIRELRAFSRMEGSLEPSADGGGLAVAGYVLSEETLGGLAELDVATIAPEAEGPSRVLLLDRDGMAPDEALRDALTRTRAEVVDAPGPGYGSVVLDWRHYPVDDVVAASVEEWIAAGAGRASGRGAVPAIAVPHIGGVATPVPGVRERPVDAGPMTGVVTEPVGERADLCVVLLNAGLQRRIGPNRMWVEMARRWAARGLTTVRLDIRGIGDAAGDPSLYGEVRRLYTEELADDVVRALDALEDQGLSGRFALGGLCSGAYWSFHAALRDERVAGLLLLNSRVLVWSDDLATRRDARVLRRKLLRAGSWRRALTGQSSYRTHLSAVGGLLARRVAGTEGSGDAADPMRGETIAPLFDRLDAQGVRTLFVFAGRQALHEELEREGLLDDLSRWPGLRVELVPGEGDTHTLRALELQRAVHELADAAVDELAASARPT